MSTSSSKSLLRFCPNKGCDSLLKYQMDLDKNELFLQCPSCDEKIHDTADSELRVKVDMVHDGHSSGKINSEMIFDPSISRTCHFTCTNCPSDEFLTEETVPNVCMFTHTNDNKQLYLLCSRCNHVWTLKKKK